MWRLAILTLAAALTAAHGSYVPSSWEKMLAVLMQNTDTTVKADTGKCSNLCYVRIPETSNRRESRHLLKIGEAIVDPSNECNRFFCYESGVVEKAITCPNDKKLCENGKARIKLPGKCCKVCNPPNNPGGNFTEWEEWTECSVTCGGGQRARKRTCQLIEDGTSVNCFGVTLQTGDCSKNPCPVHCEWEWGSYSVCSVSCGNGVRTRFPIITKQAKHGGRPCPLSVRRNDTESQACGGTGCPVNCKWLNWNAWTTCTKSCGGGKQTRTRGKIPAKNGGKDCVGSNTEEQDCGAGLCPINCKWNAWDQWTTCTKTCGGGTRTRSRGKIPAQHGGKDCEGQSTETEACNPNPCPVNCKWLDWEQWTTCSKTCGGGKRSRTRGKIPAKYGGNDCVGNPREEMDCNTQKCPVDCKWLQWGKWTACSKTCDGGKQSRVRGQIPKAYGGKECQGASREDKDCNTEKCPSCNPGYNKCKGICIPDKDGDCVEDRWDNCVNISNANQADTDGDGVGDLCDNCVYAKNPNQENNDKDKTGDKCDEDDDNDGRVDTNDNCPKVYNPGQEDKNRNGWGDVCEPKVEEAVSQEKNMSPKEKTIAAAIMERLLEMYYSSK